MTPTIQDAARANAARTLSPVELTQRMLARIRAQDGTPHAFIEVTQARARAGTLRGPLDGGARFGGPLREGLALGGLLSAADYVQAVRQRGVLCRATAAAMAGLDLLLLATQASEAEPMLEDKVWLPFEKPNYTMPFNVTGQPAISLPAGFGAGGMPVAVQLVARPWPEPLLFRAAHAYQGVAGIGSVAPEGN